MIVYHRDYSLKAFEKLLEHEKRVRRCLKNIPKYCRGKKPSILPRDLKRCRLQGVGRLVEHCKAQKALQDIFNYQK